jgi:cell division septation protein DedD
MQTDPEQCEPNPCPTTQEENPFKAFLGAFPAFSSREEINAWIRDLRDDEYEIERRSA